MGISALGTRSDGNLTTCYGVPGLSSQQMSVCQSKPDLIPTLRRGANLGITECQKQFEKERWNCSITNSSSVFGEIINIGELNLVWFFFQLKPGDFLTCFQLSCDRKSRGCLRLRDNFSWGSTRGQQVMQSRQPQWLRLWSSQKEKAAIKGLGMGRLQWRCEIWRLVVEDFYRCTWTERAQRHDRR